VDGGFRSLPYTYKVHLHLGCPCGCCSTFEETASSGCGELGDRMTASSRATDATDIALRSAAAPVAPIAIEDRYPNLS